MIFLEIEKACKSAIDKIYRQALPGKKLLLIPIALLLFASCHKKVDPKELPEVVSTSFQQKYPNAENVVWEMDGSNYEAEFKLNNEKMAAEFSPDGVFLKEE